MQNSQQVPVTVLTGFLGAGKTTLLNRILTEQHGRKYAVIVNEFGEQGIDNDLVVDADEEVFESCKISFLGRGHNDENYFRLVYSPYNTLRKQWRFMILQNASNNRPLSDPSTWGGAIMVESREQNLKPPTGPGSARQCHSSA